MKRAVRVFMVVGLLLMVAWAATAGDVDRTDPGVIHGPFPLERPLESSLDIRWDSWTPVTMQVIPEGCMGNGYKTWLIIYNSSDKDAQVSVVASGETMYITTAPFTILAHQRRTYDVAQSWECPQLKGEWTNPDVSFQVLSDTPGVYAQVTMTNGNMGYTSQGFFK